VAIRAGASVAGAALAVAAGVVALHAGWIGRRRPEAGSPGAASGRAPRRRSMRRPATPVPPAARGNDAAVEPEVVADPSRPRFAQDVVAGRPPVEARALGYNRGLPAPRVPRRVPACRDPRWMPNA
jgi:hypothetical protein